MLIQSFILWVDADLKIKYSPEVILHMREMDIQWISEAKIRKFKLLVLGVKIARQFVAVT